MDENNSGQNPIVGFCEHGNEPWVYVCGFT
jgi:hypothetical protein